MPLTRNYTKYLFIVLLISSFLITANYLTVIQPNSNADPITEGDLAIRSPGENVTFVSIPLTINIVNGTVVSMDQVAANGQRAQHRGDDADQVKGEDHVLAAAREEGGGE